MTYPSKIILEKPSNSPRNLGLGLGIRIGIGIGIGLGIGLGIGIEIEIGIGIGIEIEIGIEIALPPSLLPSHLRTYCNLLQPSSSLYPP